MQKNMKKQGISILGIIIFLALIAFIAWGLNYIITKDFVVVRAPITPVSSASADTTIPQTSTSTPNTTQTTSSTKLVATSTPTKTPEPTKTLVTSTTPASSALTVTFTDKGFSPASLTIIKGQTVTFVNKSSDKMWVAANPFPTSDEYPAFNEKTGVASGSSWSFTFDKTGVWFYHNHYSPAQGGKIVVNAK